jgi:hypothetical protein
MNAATYPNRQKAVDKSLLIRLIAEQNAAIGFTPDPNATGETAQKMTAALGIAPEDIILSCGIISARDEE